MIKFPKIKQISNIVRHVRERHDFKGMEGEEPIFRHESPYPTLTFTGTVKLHGTNASVDSDWSCFSRTRKLTPGDDNYGFARFIGGLPDEIMDIIVGVGEQVFGEWCGEGINSGCGIHKLSRRFIIFSAYSFDKFISPVFTDEELKLLNKYDVYSVRQFATKKMTVDFNQPELSDFATLVDAIEAHCPAAAYFGIDGIGEGAVWTCDDDHSTELWFKTKGQKHSATKVKVVAACDFEKSESLYDFVEKTVTDVRLNQGIEALKEVGIPTIIESTPDFLRWIFNDIIDEETEMMEASGLNKKDIGMSVSSKARLFWFKKVDKFWEL